MMVMYMNGLLGKWYIKQESFAFLFIYSSLYLFVCLFVYFIICLFICLFIYLFICLFTNIYLFVYQLINLLFIVF